MSEKYTGEMIETKQNKNKESLRNGHSQEESNETWYLNAFAGTLELLDANEGNMSVYHSVYQYGL